MNERPPHQELQLLLGAYVLGGLSATDRRRVDEHLPVCPACREELARFAVVPSLLRLATAPEPPVAPAGPVVPLAPVASVGPVTSVASVGPVGPVVPIASVAPVQQGAPVAPVQSVGLVAPVDSLPRLVAAARRKRASRFRRRWTLAAAAVVLLLGGVAGSLRLADHLNQPPTGTPVVSAFDGHAIGTAVLQGRQWGTEVQLELSYTARGSVPYSAWAVDRAGYAEQAAAWTTPADGKCSVTGATSIHHDQLDHIEVRTADGRIVFRTPAR